MTSSTDLVIYAGAKAREHIAQYGLQPADICAIPAAAGGPKGLILQGIDHFLFGDWLHQVKPAHGLQLMGASIGAWRMAAACASNPVESLKRLADEYCEEQRYPKNVTPDQITAVCDKMIKTVVGHDAQAMSTHPDRQLLVWVNKGRPVLTAHQGRAKLSGFAAATLANFVDRNWLRGYLERWVFHSTNAQMDWLTQPFDKIESHFRTLSDENITPALLASGSIPFVLNPVKQIPGAPPGSYWDGGLTDYHLALPYHRKQGIVLYPHFADRITPGWLDKFNRRRKAPTQWFDNVVMVAPSESFYQRLPGGKIPDRSDFKRYGINHTLRIRHWREAIAESHRVAEQLQAWINKPDMSQVRAL